MFEDFVGEATKNTSRLVAGVTLDDHAFAVHIDILIEWQKKQDSDHGFEQLKHYWDTVVECQT